MEGKRSRIEPESFQNMVLYIDGKISSVVGTIQRDLNHDTRTVPIM
jgi:calcineurin-like phosphoesterase